MQDAMIHYMRTCFATHGAHRQAGAAPRREVRRRQQCALRPLSVQARRPQRLGLHHHQPGQSRALVAADEADRARGADRRSALCHRRRPRRARGRGSTRSSASGRASTPSDEAMEKLIAGRRAGRRGVRHDGAAERAELRRARHHAGDEHHERRRSRWRPGRCGSTARRRGSRRRRLLGQHTAEVLDELARHRCRRDRRAEDARACCRRKPLPKRERSATR